VRVVERTRDSELEDAVPEELEPLVRERPVGRPRRVREDAGRAFLGQRVDEPPEGTEIPLVSAATGAR
jgi:hypothetical protein